MNILVVLDEDRNILFAGESVHAVARVLVEGGYLNEASECWINGNFYSLKEVFGDKIIEGLSRMGLQELIE